MINPLIEDADPQVRGSFCIFVSLNVSSIKYSSVNQLTGKFAETYIKHNIMLPILRCLIEL